MEQKRPDLAGPRSDGPQFKDLVMLGRRNLRIILGCLVLAVGTTSYFMWTARPVYEAVTTIHVDTSRPTTPEFAFITEMLRARDIDTEMALLRARSLAEATVDSLHLQVVVEAPFNVGREEVFSEVSASAITTEESYRFRRAEGYAFTRYTITDSQGRETGRLSPGEALVFNGVRVVLAEEGGGRAPLPAEFEIRTLEFTEAVGNLLEARQVARPVREASVMSVSYEGSDPALVREVPNVLASLYLDGRHDAMRREADFTVAFLEAQIAETNADLFRAEEERLDFQQGEQVVDLRAEGEAQVRLYTEAEAEKRDLESQLASLTAVLDNIADGERSADERSPYRQLAGFTTFLESQAVTELLTELNRIEAEQTAQLELRTAAHPDVVAMGEQVRQLEGELYQLALNFRQNLDNQIRAAEERLAQFGEQLERIPRNTVLLARLERHVTSLAQIFVTLQNRLQEARVAQAVESGDVRIVDPAIVPAEPIRPRKIRGLALALFFGLVVGVGIAAARDHMDERIHSRDQLNQAANLPVLAMIPRISGLSANGRRRLSRATPPATGRTLVTAMDHGSPVSEAYRAFRTNITFLNIDRPPRTVLLTSPGPSEGKSTCTSNLAVSLAQQGTKVLVVDGDLRRGVIHRMFGSKQSQPGLTNVLKGETALEDAVRVVEGNGGGALHYLATGALPPNPSELLGSDSMKTLVEVLRDRYEIVLFDSPPLNLVTDAAVLGALADGVILVARAGVTHQGAVRLARAQLDAVNAPLSGAVLNDIDVAGRARYYGDGMGYSYYRSYYRTLEEA